MCPFGTYFPNVCYWLGCILTLEKAKAQDGKGTDFQTSVKSLEPFRKIKFCFGLTSISLTFVQQLVGTGEI